MIRFFAPFALLLAAPGFAQPPSAPVALDPQSGTVVIERAKVRLTLSDEYAFYDQQDAQTILYDLWGNTRSDASDVLGLVMLENSDPRGEAWGAVVSFEEIGHVSAADARSADYELLLTQLQDAVAQGNAQQQQAGGESVRLVGWAEPPRYDSVSHAVIWGRELAFSAEPVNTLNLDVRLLGRYGVLSLNFVADMPDLLEVRAAAGDLSRQIAFEPGARYEDYNQSTDQSSGYGIAGLVAGGAGLAVAQKAGLLTVMLKPVLTVLAVLALALAARFRHLFGFGKKSKY